MAQTSPQALNHQESRLHLKRVAALVGGGKSDEPFQDTMRQDGRSALYVELQSALHAYGVELHTDDVCEQRGLTPDLQIHVNVRKSVRQARCPCHVLLLETPNVRPLNQNLNLLAQYQRVFSWQTQLSINEHSQNWRWIPAYPVPLHKTPVDGWSQRSHMCCMVASNKSMSDTSSANLYLERVQTLKWFEQHAFHNLDLYGPGWHMPVTSKDTWGALQRFWYRHVSNASAKNPFPNWKGLAESKHALMKNYRFAFCYENVAGLHGYITEKIFDAMGAGCIPIYWGAPDIEQFVPSECFIHRTHFASHEDLWQYLHDMTESEFKQRQEAMHAFMQSPRADLFSARHFGIEVAKNMVQDLGIDHEFNTH